MYESPSREATTVLGGKAAAAADMLIFATSPRTTVSFVRSAFSVSHVVLALNQLRRKSLIEKLYSPDFPSCAPGGPARTLAWVRSGR